MTPKIANLMLQNLADVVRALHDLIERGIIEDYAIGGAIGALFWDEVTFTRDLDVFVLLTNESGALVDRSQIYAWASERGYALVQEHIKIGGIPVQLVPALNAVSEEAIKGAALVPFEGVEVRVIRPEYLIAMWLSPPANDQKRRERAARLRESSHVDQASLSELMTRYHLTW